MDLHDFYIRVPAPHGGPSLYYKGAVLFASAKESLYGSCEVLRVYIPHPETTHVETTLLQGPRLIFPQMKKKDVITFISDYCTRGAPIPNIFADNIAAVEGLTPFQTACYQQACRVPHGETRSYQWIAGALRKNKACQAVGQAMRSNPFPLVIPCHRIIRHNGDIGGFMGAHGSARWECHVKKILQELEAHYKQPSLFNIL